MYLICACEKLVRVSLVTSASLKGWFHGPVSHILDTHYSPQSAERYNSYKLEENGIRRKGGTEEGLNVLSK